LTFDIINPLFLWWTTLGVVLGVTVGCIPGLTGAMVIALTLPLTFAMSPPDALTLLVAIYVGSVSGGLISATLLNIPGTPASLMTTLDGFPMADGGRPKRALSLGIAASLAGGIFSWGVLTLLAEPMAVWSTKIGPPDMFSLVMLALVLIAVISRESLTMGLLAGGLGLLFAMPGMHPATGQSRLTFGFDELNDGIRLLPVLIGLFAVSQLVKDVGANDTAGLNVAGSETPRAPVSAQQLPQSATDVAPSFRDWLVAFPNLLRSSVIGTVVGILPGVGANIGSILAYATARSQSAAPSDFGTGCEEGIISSEAANNATVGGALIPLISLGIPGSVIDAILLGAFVIHGLQPGPLLFQNNPEIVHTITQSYLMANIIMFGFMLLTARWMVRLVQIPKGLLVPVVLTFCVLGSYALANRMFDVWVMVAFGGFGLLFDRLRIPTAPFVIGFVLSPIAEQNLCAALMASDGSWWPFVQEPVSAAFLGISAIVCVLTLRRRRGTS
jgi:putative tricarboxylic transport membrane protein